MFYVIQYRDSKNAIDSERNLVKISDPNLWKPSSPEIWKAGHEIRSDAIGISLFNSKAKQELHYHGRTWELYQVIEGILAIAVKHYREGSWRAFDLEEHDILLMEPGTPHLVGCGYQHITQVIQSPPALSDKFLIDNEQEIKLANEALNNVYKHKAK